MAKREFLAKGKVVSASQWRHEYSHGRHEYSHVAFGDRTGRLTLCDRAVLRWLARPASPPLEWPDGRKTYRVRCCVEGSPRIAPEAPGPDASRPDGSTGRRAASWRDGRLAGSPTS